MNGYVTDNKKFKYKEFCVSKKYPKLAEAIVLSTSQRESIKLGVESILDPLRKATGSPIKINSGYRSFDLNEKLSGSKTSDHMSACACDIVCKGLTAAQLYSLMLNMNLPYRQLIYYPKKKFVHVSWNIPGRKYKRETFLK